MTFKLAIIGHSKFYEATVEGISKEDLKQHVKFVCVNEKLPKVVPAEFPTECIMNEWDIPNYEAYYQANYFYQNSFFFNLMNVIDTMGLDQVGFAQYDMIFTPEILDHIKETCVDPKAAVGFYPFSIEALFDVLQPDLWQFVIQQYSNFFDVAVTDVSRLDTMKLALFHTFVIPVETYKRMMAFTKSILQSAIAFLGNDATHVAGTLERVFALFLNLEIINGNMKEFKWVDGLVHDDVNLRLPDQFRGIG
jgi:hypothetical protein